MLDKAKELEDMKRRVDIKLGRYNEELFNQTLTSANMTLNASLSGNSTLNGNRTANLTNGTLAAPKVISVSIPNQVKADLEMLTQKKIEEATSQEIIEYNSKILNKNEDKTFTNVLKNAPKVNYEVEVLHMADKKANLTSSGNQT